MLLRDYVAALPRGERTKFRRKLADEHKCSESLVRKWEADPPPKNWTPEQCRKMVRRHPSDMAAIIKTESLTCKEVTRHDLRPECWPIENE